MPIEIRRVDLTEIQYLRQLFLQENNVQIRYHACHERGWSDCWLILADGIPAGYGSVKGRDDLIDRDAIFEFYLLPERRMQADDYFTELVRVSRAAWVESQTNVPLLTGLAMRHAGQISGGPILFADHFVSRLHQPDLRLRRREKDEAVYGLHDRDLGDFVVEKDEQAVASGGFLLHYNLPFADLHMAVAEGHRRHGYGSWLVQELKRECYRAGRVPAARCQPGNLASRRTLLAAGMRENGRMITGQLNLA